MDTETTPATKANAPSSVNSSRVTIAFPFSAIKIQDPGEELKELAAIVVALAEQLAEVKHDEAADALVKRALALGTKLAD